MSEIISLCCFHCGAAKEAEVAGSPRFAFEVAGWANDIGMLGVLDMKRHRALVFCNADCAKAEQLRDGSFRLRARGISA